MSILLWIRFSHFIRSFSLRSRSRSRSFNISTRFNTALYRSSSCFISSMRSFISLLLEERSDNFFISSSYIFTLSIGCPTPLAHSSAPQGVCFATLASPPFSPWESWEFMFFLKVKPLWESCKHVSWKHVSWLHGLLESIDSKDLEEDGKQKLVSANSVLFFILLFILLLFRIFLLISHTFKHSCLKVLDLESLFEVVCFFRPELCS